MSCDGLVTKDNRRGYLTLLAVKSWSEIEIEIRGK
jgi:hypothetical protein